MRPSAAQSTKHVLPKKPQMAPDLSQHTDPVAPVAGRDRRFRTDSLKANLGARTARGGAVTIASQGFKFVASIAATVVLARLLRPADYGLVGMVAVVTGFVTMFKDLGLSAATVQREEITHAQVSTLFWVNVALSVGVAALTAAIAPAVAWFYGEPRLTAITLAYCVGFLFGGLTVQHEALLRRQMRFGVLALAEVAALLASIVVTVLLAWYGAGYWSLVGGHLALSLVYMIGAWAACGWMPGAPERGSDVRSMLAFGGNLTGFSIVNYFARNLDNLLIGRFWGSQQLGLYAKAYQLLLLPIDQINSPFTTVAVPALSRLNDAPERYRRAYLRILEKVAMLTMPGIAFMVAVSDWVVLIVLGPQWTEAGRIFAVLGVAALVQPITNTTGWLFITQGRARHMLQWGFVGGTISSSIVVGLHGGRRRRHVLLARLRLYRDAAALLFRRSGRPRARRRFLRDRGPFSLCVARRAGRALSVSPLGHDTEPPRRRRRRLVDCARRRARRPLRAASREACAEGRARGNRHRPQEERGRSRRLKKFAPAALRAFARISPSHDSPRP